MSFSQDQEKWHDNFSGQKIFKQKIRVKFRRKTSKLTFRIRIRLKEGKNTKKLFPGLIRGLVKTAHNNLRDKIK